MQQRRESCEPSAVLRTSKRPSMNNARQRFPTQAPIVTLSTTKICTFQIRVWSGQSFVLCPESVPGAILSTQTFTLPQFRLYLVLISRRANNRKIPYARPSKQMSTVRSIDIRHVSQACSSPPSVRSTSSDTIIHRLRASPQVISFPRRSHTIPSTTNASPPSCGGRHGMLRTSRGRHAR